MDWWILDIAFNPSCDHLVYSNWSDCRKCTFYFLYLIKFDEKKYRQIHRCKMLTVVVVAVHLSRIDGAPHELMPLYLEPPVNYSFCIFSVTFSNCGNQIIGGGSDGCLYVYDLVLAKRTFQYPVSVLYIPRYILYYVHVDRRIWFVNTSTNTTNFRDDLKFHFILQIELGEINVNSVGFIDDTSNIIYSGSDNGIIKVKHLDNVYVSENLNDIFHNRYGIFDV